MSGLWHISYYKYCFQFNTSGEGMRGWGGDLGFAMKAGGEGRWEEVGSITGAQQLSELKQSTGLSSNFRKRS